MRVACSLCWGPVDTTFRGSRRENVMKTVLLVWDKGPCRRGILNAMAGFTKQRTMTLQIETATASLERFGPSSLLQASGGLLGLALTPSELSQDPPAF
jgi:hypothetical protein